MIENLDLDNLLLLFLADELPPADRKRLEQQLAADPPLRLRLAQLQAADESMNDGLARLDEMSPPIHAGTISQRLGRVLRQELARPRARSAHVAGPHRRIWPWILPGAAAASILVAAAVWIDRQVGAVANQPETTIAETAAPTSSPAGPPQIAHRTHVSESNYALWIDSFRQVPVWPTDLADSRPSDDDSRTAAPASKDDAAASQDPVSQYLLSSLSASG